VSRLHVNPQPASVVEGYLAEALPPASRNPDTAAFAAGEAVLNVWEWLRAPDSASPAVWTNRRATVKLRNTSETLSGEENSYCMARWAGDHWQPIHVSCAASLVPLD
jgi:hypothetical protein